MLNTHITVDWRISPHPPTIPISQWVISLRVVMDMQSYWQRIMYASANPGTPVLSQTSYRRLTVIESQLARLEQKMRLPGMDALSRRYLELIEEQAEVLTSRNGDAMSVAMDAGLLALELLEEIRTEQPVDTSRWLKDPWIWDQREAISEVQAQVMEIITTEALRLGETASNLQQAQEQIIRSSQRSGPGQETGPLSTGSSSPKEGLPLQL